MRNTKNVKQYITLFIVLLAFFIRVIRLDIPHEWSFDEVYHGLSAEAYALNDPRGYEWWNTSPKDLAYEWLHPPLGKLFMAASIKLFAHPYIPESKAQTLDGATTFAWRFPGTIFAALTVWLLIKFGEKLFGNFWIGAVAGGLYALDGLSFVQSRTGMNDIYVTFFIVLAFYRLFIFIKEYKQKEFLPFVKGEVRRGSSIDGKKGTHPDPLFRKEREALKNLFLVGLATGLAASTKWTGFYVVAICCMWGVVFLLKKQDWKLFFKAGLLLSLLPILIYFLSYSQWWVQGHTWKQFVELHQQIWWYQTGLKATHDYQSQALTWPILQRPVWFYVTYQDVMKNGVKTLYIGNIYTMGHPFIWWAGLVAIVYLVWEYLWGIWWKIHNNSSRLLSNNILLSFAIILAGYFGMFLPWTFSPRIMFLYHYLPSVPFLCLALAYGLGRVREVGAVWGIKKSGESLVTVYLTLVVLGFIYFYPHWSALPLPQSWVDHYYWFKSWK